MQYLIMERYRRKDHFGILPRELLVKKSRTEKHGKQKTLPARAVEQTKPASQSAWQAIK